MRYLISALSADSAVNIGFTQLKTAIVFRTEVIDGYK